MWRVLVALLLAGLLGLAQATEVTLEDLPPEARTTLRLIEQGGPFPYRRDGVVFGNYERRLPLRARGYYHEYTVPTPGARDRGARRIIAGNAGERYYTNDHYRTFRRIRQ
jgi:ribonuclease T1